MAKSKRTPTTVYLEPGIAKAIKVKAALNDKSFSDLVNDALARDVKRDVEYLALFEKRKNQPTRDYDEFIAELKRDGLI